MGKKTDFGRGRFLGTRLGDFEAKTRPKQGKIAVKAEDINPQDIEMILQ